jgi:dTDP-4-dehydrorhamnose reductase
MRVIRASRVIRVTKNDPPLQHPSCVKLQDVSTIPRRTVLVTGASGVIGWNLAKGLLAAGFQVTGTYRVNRPDLGGARTLALDLDHPEQLPRHLKGISVAAVVHTAAMTSPDQCQSNPVAARRVNVEATRVLAELFPPEVPLLYFSTDLVFDGTHGLYREEDPPNPVNVYGESKAEAELIVGSRPGSVILRISKIYSGGSPYHPCFVDWMRTRFERGLPVPLFQDQFRSPLWVGDLTRVVAAVIREGIRGPLYHVGGPERLSRLEFGQAYAREMGFSSALIQPMTMAEAGLVARGADCSLISDRLRRDYGLVGTRVEEGLRLLRKKGGAGSDSDPAPGTTHEGRSE